MMPGDSGQPGSSARLEELIARLGEIEREIQVLTRDQIDAVVLPDGLPFLLSDAQAALRQREADQRTYAEQRRAILDALPALIVLLDGEGNIVEENRNWRKAGATSAGESPSLGLNYLEVCDRAVGEDASYARATADGIREVLAAKRKEFELAYPCVVPGKGELWFRLLVAPLAEQAPERGAVVLHQDVTAEYREARRLQGEQQHFRELFDLSPAPMWVFDAETYAFLAVNDAAVERYGYTREEFLGMTVLDIRPEADRPALKAYLEKPADGSRRSGVWQHRTKAGVVIDVEVNAQSVDFNNRNARLVLARDITESRRHERAQAAEAGVLSAISTRLPLSRVLHLIAEGLEEIVPDTVASVVLLTEDGKRMHHGAAPSLPARFTNAIEGMGIGPRAGCCGTAMHRGETVVVEDIRTDPLWRDCSDLVEEMGLRACWSLPMRDSNANVVGALAMYYREPRNPEAWERELIDRFGALAGLAVERQRQDEALETSERRLKKLFREAATGIVVITEAGDFEQANGVFARILGRDEADLRDKPGELNYHDITHAADRAAVRRAMRALLSGASQAETLEQRFIAKGGNEAWGRVRFSAQSGRDGRPSRVIAVIEEITLRKQAELRLQRASALQRIAGRIGRVGGWAVDLENDEIFWSPEIFEILEWDADDPPPLSQAMQRWRPEHRAEAQTALERCAKQGTPFDIEGEVETWGHRRLQVRAAGEAETGPEDNVRRVIGVFQDITELRKAEAQRAELAGRLENVLENMSDAFLLIGSDWTVNYINRAGERMVRFPRRELLGRNLWDAFPEARHSVISQQYERAMQTGESAHFEIWYEPLENWFEINAYPSEEGLAVYFSETTEKRKLEAQLQQAQRLESVGQLTGGIAHDFNNLLTVILGNAELLAESLADSEELAPIARSIEQAAMRGAELTQRLLAFARRQPLEPEAIDVNRLIREFEPLMRRALGEACEIEVSRGAGLWPAMIDASQLESALMNLAINGRDAMPGGGRLTIETANVRIDDEYQQMHPDVSVGQYVLVAVSDTGGGISAEDIDKVFEPFFTTKAKGSGTGLGLSMVYGFVKQSKGHIRIYSEIGEGTTVRLYLPRAPGDQLPERDVESSSDTGRGERILVVEDDPAVREFAVAALEHLGYRVQPASGGSEALALLENGREFDLLFTDVVMPGGMSGRELAEAAARLRPGLKVLYTSGYTENAVVHHGRLDPDVQLLSKPYRRDELARRVRRVLDGHSRGQHRE